jgi:hypothetical protein
VRCGAGRGFHCIFAKVTMRSKKVTITFGNVTITCEKLTMIPEKVTITTKIVTITSPPSRQHTKKPTIPKNSRSQKY